MTASNPHIRKFNSHHLNSSSIITSIPAAKAYAFQIHPSCLSCISNKTFNFLHIRILWRYLVFLGVSFSSSNILASTIATLWCIWRWKNFFFLGLISFYFSYLFFQV
ncbi:hypothetical protein DFH27DRAFT_584908 [Peziza echinospora]|nr:hypothetical protein DFH27DRAFT_584908 [Peziza echinospora]